MYSETQVMKNMDVDATILSVPVLYADRVNRSLIIHLSPPEQEQTAEERAWFTEEAIHMNNRGFYVELEFSYHEDVFTQSYVSLREILSEIGGLIALMKLIIATAGIFGSIQFI